MSTIARASSAYAYPLLIRHMLHAPMAHARGQQIVYRDLRRHTYAELEERIARLANALADLGVRPGDTVAMLDWDSHRYLEAYFAVPMMGATLMTANVRLSSEQLAYTLNRSGAKLLLVNADFMPLVNALRPRLERVQTCILLADDAREPPAGYAGEYEALLARAGASREFDDFDENTPATVFFTSGTTGLPKGVSFSHRQLVLHTLATMGFAAASAPGQSFRRDDVYMPMTPMFHVHAWGAPYVATALGVKQVYPGRYQPRTLLRLRHDEGVTYSHCVPTILQMLLSVPQDEAGDLRGWKIAIGGAALPKALCRAALERGIDVWAGYGMSESGPVLASAQVRAPAATLDDEVALRCKSGLTAPLVEMRIVDADMKTLPHDGRATGEIVVRAPWLVQAYLDDPAASEALWHGGYLHTQDLGAIDADGMLQITDRLKDVIKSGGEWVSSTAIEDLLEQHPAVAEAAVFGVRDEKWGERPLALVVAKPGHAEGAGETALKAHLEQYVTSGVLSRIAVPQSIRLVEALPKTSVGKVDKKLLRQDYAAGHATFAGPGAMPPGESAPPPKGMASADPVS
jgi:fatty-acyl-CoA synthase